MTEAERVVELTWEEAREVGRRLMEDAEEGERAERESIEPR